MQVFKFHRSSLSQVSKQHLNLVYRQEAYLPFINHTFSFENFDRQILEKEKNYQLESREILVEALLKQHEELSGFNELKAKIESLRDPDTFTITTGHQLSLFTGPLYFVVKILHVIKLCKQLKGKYPENNFVPVYWMASEDHDFEEIQKMQLFSKEFKWNSDQEGPVGRFNLEGFDEVKAQVKEMFSNPDAEILELLDAYSGNNLTEATRNLNHELFKKYGLVIVDGDDRQLKKIFSPIIKKELLEEFSYQEVIATNDKLVNEGVKLQVKPREINLFYILDGVRKRIVKKENNFLVEGLATFSEDEILQELTDFPERFSPNVILRPLYQEFILPNLAYIGGSGEISYWLQLKQVFDAVDCTFPLIAVRNSVLWIDPVTAKKKAKIDLLLENIFKTKDQLKKDYVEKNSNGELDFRSVEKASEKLIDSLDELILNVDGSMQGFAKSEETRILKQIENIKSKLIKISKSKHSVAMNNIDQIMDKLFPNDNLQEREVNFFSFCPDGNYKKQLNKLYLALDPEEKDLLIIREI